jgi:hypothetical protein
MIVWSRTLPAVTRRMWACSSAVRVVGLRLAIADRRVEAGEEVKGKRRANGGAPSTRLRATDRAIISRQQVMRFQGGRSCGEGQRAVIREEPVGWVPTR